MTGSRADAIFMAVAALLVAAAIAAGIYAIGMPSAARVRQLDARRVADLQDIQRSIDVGWAREERLPATLDEIGARGDLPAAARDPGSGEPYEYRVVSEKTYELCAQFSEPSTTADQRPRGDFWWHGPGRQCFRIEARRVRP